MNSKILCLMVSLLPFTSSAACGSRGPDDTAHGMVSAAWSITVLGRPATCAQVGAASVSLLLDNRASGAAIAFAFPCADGQGVTPPVVAGPYRATIALLATDGAAIATVPSQAPVTIGADQVTALPQVTFAASETGALSLQVATLGTATNCQPRDEGGAGITSHVITLEHAATGCAPVTFVRSRGATRVGTYTVHCSSPQVATCIERDEMLTIDGIASGPYTISVIGRIGATRCWAATDVLSIPAGPSLVRPIQLAPQSAAGC